MTLVVVVVAAAAVTQAVKADRAEHQIIVWDFITDTDQWAEQDFTASAAEIILHILLQQEQARCITTQHTVEGAQVVLEQQLLVSQVV
jgi:hypothetical protein